MKGKKPGSATGATGKTQKVKTVGADAIGNPAEVTNVSFLSISG